MFLFEVGQEVTVGKVTYEIKSRFELQDQYWYTVTDTYDNSLDNLEESRFFKNKSEYDKARMTHKIAQLEAEIVTLKNDKEYYKNLYSSINRRGSYYY